MYNFYNVADDILKIVYVQNDITCNRMAENLTKVPKRGILKQSTSFEQRGEEKYVGTFLNIQY